MSGQPAAGAAALVALLLLALALGLASRSERTKRRQSSTLGGLALLVGGAARTALGCACVSSAPPPHPLPRN